VTEISAFTTQLQGLKLGLTQEVNNAASVVFRWLADPEWCVQNADKLASLHSFLSENPSIGNRVWAFFESTQKRDGDFVILRRDTIASCCCCCSGGDVAM